MFYYLTAILTALRMLGVSGGSYLLGKSLWLPIILGYSVWILTIPASLLLRMHHYDRVPQGEEFESYPIEASLPDGHAGPGALDDIDGQDQHDTNERREKYQALESFTSTPRETSNESSHFNEARYTKNSTRYSLASPLLGHMVTRTGFSKKPWRGLTTILAPFSTSGLPMHGWRSVWM